MTAHNHPKSELRFVDLLFCPGGEEEREVRSRIIEGRDTAQRRASNEAYPEAARAIYWLALDLANAWLGASATVEQLTAVRYTLVRMYLAAGAITRLGMDQ